MKAMKKMGSVGWLYISMFTIAILGALVIRIYQLDIVYVLILYFLIFIIGMVGLLSIIIKTHGKKRK
jgi:Flp pilus assembly protein TadB